jgi:hypothetical protein
MRPAEAGSPLISEKEIDFVFNANVIAEIAKDIKAPPDGVARFGDNVRAAARAYLAEHARTNWKAIGEQIGDLYGLVDARRGSELAIRRVAARIGLIDRATRNWLERCAHRPLSFPSSEEILDRRTQKQAIKELRNILSYGQERVKARKRPGGKRSRPTFQPVLRVPENLRGRPRDLAARELVQQLALAYLEATGRSPPRSVSLRSRGPFLRLVRVCFDLVGIPAGGVVDLINEREIRRKKLERLHPLRTKHYGLKEN